MRLDAKHKTWIDSAVFVIGTSITKCLPIIIGLYFSRFFSVDAYSSYVAFMVMANLIAAVPLMGNSLLTLSAPAGWGSATFLRSIISTITIHTACYFLVLVALTIKDAYLRDISKTTEISTTLALYAFSLGYALTGTAAAAMNRSGHSAIASCYWLLSSITGLIACIGFSWISDLTSFGLLALSCSWLFCGSLSTFSVYRKLITLSSESQKSAPQFAGISRKNLGSELGQAALAGLPSVIFLAGFSIALEHISIAANTTTRGAFSLGYQIFSLILLIPGILGNIATPKLSAVLHNREKMRKLSAKFAFLYLTIAGTLSTLIYAFTPKIFSAFGLAAQDNSITIINIFLLASFFAAALALLNQIAAAERAFSKITWSAIVWFLSTTLMLNTSTDAGLASAIGVLSGYLVSTIFGTITTVYLYKKKHACSQN